MEKPLKTGYLIEEGSRVVFVDDPHANLRIYELPGPHSAIGADVAEGIEEDSSAAIVLNCEDNNTMAAYDSNKIDPDEYALFLKKLGIYYKYPLIGVERNSVGFSVVSDLLKIYPVRYIYFHMKYDEKKKVKTKKFGWLTNDHTRNLMLGYFKKEVREDFTNLVDKPLIQQCMRFVRIDGKPQASSGEHDDLVIARAIAGMMKRHRPLRIKAVPKVAAVPRQY